MTVIHRIRRLAGVLACALLASAAAAPAALAVNRPLPDGRPAFVPTYPATSPASAVIAGGGMPGWQIALVAVGSALVAATVAVILDRALATRKVHATTALPASVGDRKRSISGVSRSWSLGLGMPGSAPCALIAAGFCERAGGSWGAQRPRSGTAGALDAAVRERIMPGGRGTGRCGWGSGSVVQAGGLSVRGDQPWRPRGAGPWGSQPYLGPRGLGAAPAT